MTRKQIQCLKHTRVKRRSACVLLLGCCLLLAACTDGKDDVVPVAERTPMQLCFAEPENVPPAERSDKELFTLPDPLILADGTPVDSPRVWRERRRPELLEQFAINMYGLTPTASPSIEWEMLDDSRGVLDGTADRLQVRGHLGGAGGPTMDILVYLPSGMRDPVPLYVTMSYLGNHAATADPGVLFPPMSVAQVIAEGGTVADLEEARDSRFGRIPGFPNAYIERGYAIALYWYQELARDPLLPDAQELADVFDTGIFPLFFTPAQTARHPDEWGGLGVWAWGLSRLIDWAETEERIDHERVAAFGSSRLGKVALWAAAQDERIDVTWASISGSGGAVLTRRDYAPVWHWFAENYNCWSGRVQELPIDQHELLALIAPRPVYITEGLTDPFSDAQGAFISASQASAVYALFGLEGLPATTLPEPGSPAVGSVGFSVHPGGHTVPPEQLEEALDFVDQHLRK